MSKPMLKPISKPRSCVHRRLRWMGKDGNIGHYECPDCGKHLEAYVVED